LKGFFFSRHFRSIFKAFHNACHTWVYRDPAPIAYKGTAFGNYRNMLKKNFKLFTISKNKQDDDYAFTVSRVVLLLAFF